VPADEAEEQDYPTASRPLPVTVESTSLAGKHLVGYQGWFTCPGDGSQIDGWLHWSPSVEPAPGNVSFDAWPEVSDLPEDGLCDTNFVLADGEPARLFSSNNPAVVDRHFEWMAEHGIHGALLQRFSNALHLPPHLAFRDQVATNTLNAARQHGRVFAVVYDITGTDESDWVARVMDDWRHLVDDLQLPDSNRYLREGDRPLVGIWGIGFTDRPGTAAEASQLLDFFQDNPEPRYRATVLGGVPTHWRTLSGDARPETEWLGVYGRLDVLSPWTVGRYRTPAEADQHRLTIQQPDITWTDARGISYLPVIFPGFSWANLTGDPTTFNLIPRQGGRFYWRQLYNAVDMGATSVMTAMFDEVDEATAIIPIAANASRIPTTGQFLHSSQDGEALPADWYLRLAGAASEVVEGSRVNSVQIPISPISPITTGDPPAPPEPDPLPPPGSDPEADLADYRVTLAYRGILGREPDAAGLSSYSALLQQGQSVLWLCDILASSSEFMSNRAQLSPEELAIELYLGTLGREPDPTGLAATIAAIESGQMPARAAAMILSNEAQQNFQ
jgi:hypothetical protein